MAELGNTLSRARRARGITLEDAERDTHVSRRYLQALETEDFAIFPAPVYARGFLRTYSRYLGLNPDELVRVFPNGSLTVDIEPLPSVARPQAQLIDVNWVIAGLVMLFLLAAGLLLLRDQSDGTIVGEAPLQTAIAGASQSNGGQALVAPQTDLSAPVAGKSIGPIRPDQYPDFVGADIASTLAVLRDNQLSYAIIEMPSSAAPRGIVIGQSPSAGASVKAGSSITIVVSKGASP